MLPYAGHCRVGSCSHVWRLLPCIQHQTWVGALVLAALPPHSFPRLFHQNLELPRGVGNPCPAPRLHSISTELKEAALSEGTGRINPQEAAQDAGDKQQFSYLGKLVRSPASLRLTSKRGNQHLFSPDHAESAVLIRYFRTNSKRRKIAQGEIWVATARRGAAAQDWLPHSSLCCGQSIFIFSAFHKRFRGRVP